MGEVAARVWRDVLALRHGAGGAGVDSLRARLQAAAPPVRDVYLPLVRRMAGAPLTLAQIGQSIDGRIATESGHSHYINGPDGLDHLHRLRALVDAVVVGAGTAVLDDPQLTTRRVEGPSPVRVVLDPHGRVPADRRCFDGAAPTLRLVAEEAPDGPCAGPGDVPGIGPKVLCLPAPGGVFGAADILHALHRRGLRVVLIEGGSATLSGFLQAGALDRLHVLLAPLLVGSGRVAFPLPVIERLDEARRFRMTAHPLGSDVLLDCRLKPGE